MKLYRLSELRQFLEELGVDPKKGLSQNFLIDGNILQKILKTATISPYDRVLEIGAGPGALTQALLDKGAFVTAVEIDPIYAQALQQLQTNAHALTIIQTDFLKLSPRDFFTQPSDSKSPAQGKWKVVANLPYHITTPILTSLLPLHQYIESITIMVQKEFGKRMTAKPSSPDYGSFTLFTQFYSQPTYCFTVEPTCFYPRPSVQSAVVQCKLQPPPAHVLEEDFFIFTRSTFQQRRKMLRASLKNRFSPQLIEQTLLAMALPATARPEELSLQQFLLLFKALS